MAIQGVLDSTNNVSVDFIPSQTVSQFQISRHDSGQVFVEAKAPGQTYFQIVTDGTVDSGVLNTVDAQVVYRVHAENLDENETVEFYMGP